MAFRIHNVTSDVWLQRPALAGHIATVSQLWARIEYELSLIFIILSGSNLAMGAVFSDIIAVRTQLRMIETLAIAFLDEDDQDEFNTLQTRVSALSKRRNSIVHGLWSVREDKPNTIFLHRMFALTQAEARPIPYTHRTFVSVENDLEALRRDLAQFGSHLSELAEAKPFPQPFLLPRRRRGNR